MKSAEAFYNQTLLLTADKAREVDAFFDARRRGVKLEEFAPEARHGGGGSDRHEFEIRDGVAVIPLMGVIAKRMNFMTRFSGGTSMTLFAEAMQNLIDDPNVRAIVMEVDSPGGAAAGTDELANLIYEARGDKPIVSVANDSMTSGAYYIASSADIVVVSTSAYVGSIGVIAVYKDFTQAEKKAGIKSTIIQSGRYKSAGWPEKKMSSDEHDYLQERSDTIYTMFVDSVARNRGVSTDAVLARMADAQIFIGRQAVEAGLADATGTLDQVVAALANDEFQIENGEINVTEKTKKTTSGKSTTADEPTQLTAAQLREQNPDAVAEIEKAAAAKAEDDLKTKADETQSESDVETAKTEAAAAEQKRQSDIRAICAEAGMPSKADTFCANLKTTVADVREHLFDSLCKKNTAPAEDSDGGIPDKTDPAAAAKKEYAENRAHFSRMGITEEEYVTSQQIDSGELDLVVGATA